MVTSILRAIVTARIYRTSASNDIVRNEVSLQSVHFGCWAFSQSNFPVLLPTNGPPLPLTRSQICLENRSPDRQVFSRFPVREITPLPDRDVLAFCLAAIQSVVSVDFAYHVSPARIPARPDFRFLRDG
jgi:hypothetical protein